MITSISESATNKKKENLEAQHFFNRFPFAPQPGQIDCLDYVLNDKEEAIRIAKGEQKILMRRITGFIFNEITDANVIRWKTRQACNGEDKEKLYEYFPTTKTVWSLHLHDWKDTWFVDVDVKGIRSEEMSKELIKELKQNKIKTKQYEDELRWENDVRDWLDEGVEWVSEAMIWDYFIFELGCVRATDLVAFKPITRSKGAEKNLGADNFFDKHPDAPESEDLYTVDFVIDKEEAKKIARCEPGKSIFLRPCNWLYDEMLIDSDVAEWRSKRREEGENIDALSYYVDMQKMVDIVCFQDLTDDWYLNMNVEYDGTLCLDADGIDLLHEHNNHDMDDYFNQIEKEIENGLRNPNDRPQYYFFVFDAVLGTDLDLTIKAKNIELKL